MQNPKMKKTLKKSALRARFGIVLHSWVLQSAPPVIYLHIWNALIFAFWSFCSRPGLSGPLGPNKNIYLLLCLGVQNPLKSPSPGPGIDPSPGRRVSIRICPDRPACLEDEDTKRRGLRSRPIDGPPCSQARGPIQRRSRPQDRHLLCGS